MTMSEEGGRKRGHGRRNATMGVKRAGAGKKLAILCDFDGTVTIEEVSVSLLKKYTGDHWLKADRDLYEGRVTLRETMKREFSLLKAPREEMEEFVRGIHLRPGFGELVEAARNAGVPLVIVSEGLDFYIAAFLEHHGLDVQFWTNRAIFTPEGVRVEYPYSWEECDYCGNCKYGHIINFRNEGCTTVYIGDGISDRCPARKADILFARDGLLDFCRKEKLACIPYEDFRDVLRSLRDRGLISRGIVDRMPRAGGVRDAGKGGPAKGKRLRPTSICISRGGAPSRRRRGSRPTRPRRTS